MKGSNRRWEKLHNDELRNSYCSSNTVRLVRKIWENGMACRIIRTEESTIGKKYSL